MRPTIKSDLIWINGEISPFSQARIGVEDRGYQFADGVYEVVRLYDGRPFTLAEHLARLARSAAAIEIPMPLAPDALALEIRRLIDKCSIADGMVYLQLTRGCAPRNHVFPDHPRPTLLFYVRPLPPVPAPGTGAGAKLMAVADERWKRCWIKSIALLPNVLAKSQAVARGYDEAVFIDEGIVTECSASNFFAVQNGKLITHPVGPKVLPGVTRAVLLECATGLNIDVEERAVTEAEARSAAELFITSTTREISWVAFWNEQPVGQARCGPITRALHEALQERIQRETQIARTAPMMVIAKSA